MRTRHTAAGWFHMALILINASTLTSCSAVQHGYQLDDVVSRSLSTATPAGERRLAIELEYDSAVRDIVARKGRPEWLYVVSRDQLYLYFTSRDEVVVITRPMVPPGQMKIYERSPGFLLNLLPKHAVDALQAERSARAARTKVRPTRRARIRRRQAPAAIAPRPTDAGTSFQKFNTNRIVKRLRTPLSAADPGVTRWRIGRTRDGQSARIGMSGTTRYMVRSDAITVSVPIAPRRREAPAKASHAIYRINRAVFGTRADRIERRIGPLVSQVAADTSGRTRIHRPIGGRIVSVTRDPRRGLLIYSVLSN